MAERTRRKAENHPTGAQLRAARALANMSVAQLAELTNLAMNTIKRAERTNGPAPLTMANAALLVSTLEQNGVRFIPADDECGAGVRLELPLEGTDPQHSRRRTASSS